MDGENLSARSSTTRWVEVVPERLSGWVDRFGTRHGGEPEISLVGGRLVLVAPDGEQAECHAPPGTRQVTGSGADLVGEFVREAARPLPRGLLLARRGGFAAGTFAGTRLVSSKVDSWYVQGRTAAGGWSQQRFARRRDNQAKAFANHSAAICARLLVPEARKLVAVMTGGDRALVAAILADPRVAPLRPLVAEHFLSVPDPKLDVLRTTVDRARAVRIRLLTISG